MPMKAIGEMNEKLSDLKVKSLPVDGDKRIELKSIVDNPRYYLDNCHRMLELLLDQIGKPLTEVRLACFGGFGIMAILAKKLGFGMVVQVEADNNDRLATIAVADFFGLSPDMILAGTAASLRSWCVDNREVLDAVVAIDVIDKIYVLDEFFSSLHAISPSLHMVLSSQANPCNKRVVRRLHKQMDADELGTVRRKGFWQMRRDGIERQYPDMSDRELDFWADNTRGLNNEDLLRAVESRSPNLLLDEHNTCNPDSGRWSSRILTIEEYRQLLLPYGFSVDVIPGMCNEYVRGLRRFGNRRRNRKIAKFDPYDSRKLRRRRLLRKALKVSPFICLIVSPKNGQ